MVIADLAEQYQFQTSLAFTDLRPDLVAYSCLAKTAIIVELTVCFETNFKDAQKRKETKYTELVEEVEKNDFIVDLIILEVGSRYFVNYESFRRLREVAGATPKD